MPTARLLLWQLTVQPWRRACSLPPGPGSAVAAGTGAWFLDSHPGAQPQGATLGAPRGAVPGFQGQSNMQNTDS